MDKQTSTKDTTGMPQERATLAQNGETPWWVAGDIKPAAVHNGERWLTSGEIRDVAAGIYNAVRMTDTE